VYRGTLPPDRPLNDTIEVFRILHSARDIGRIIKPKN